MNLKQRVNRLRREVTALEEDEQPIVVLLSGDPEPHRLLGRSLSAREAMIGSEVFAAKDGETIKAFHRRLVALARERRIASGVTSGIAVVSVGDDTPELPCRYDAEGKLIVLN